MNSLGVLAFASHEWVRQLDAALAPLALDGPPLRIRYCFTGPGTTVRGYDLLLGPGATARPLEADTVPADPAGTVPAATDAAVAGAERSASTGIAAPSAPSPPPSPQVTITQSLSLAAEVAAGRESAQRALLQGDITISGEVTALLGWAAALHTIEVAMAPLRACTTWPI